MIFNKKFLIPIVAASGFIFSMNPVSAEKIPESEQTSIVEKTVSENDLNKNFSIDVSAFNEEKSEEEKQLIAGISSDVVKKILPLSIEARYYAPHFDINVKSDKIFYNDGTVGLKDDLGFGNDKAPELILRYKRLTVDYMRVHGDGARVFSGTDVLTFGGRRFHGQVDSESTLQYLKLNVTNPIFSVAGTGLDWSYGLTGIFWKGKVKGSDTMGRHEERSEDYAIPVPTFGVGGHIQLWDNLRAYAHISGLPLGGYGHFYDFEAAIRYNPIENLGITVGFRRIHANVSHEDDSGNFTLNGPFAGVRFDF